MIPLLFTWLLKPLLCWRAGPLECPPRRILVIQLAKIGDLICSTPVFRALRQRYPETMLDVMISPANALLLANNPHVDNCIVARATDFKGLRGKWALAKLMRQGGYDSVISLNANSTFAIASVWAGIPRRLSILSNFGGSSHRVAASLWSAVEMHQTDRLIQLTQLALLKNLDVCSSVVDKEVFTVTGAAQRVEKVVSHPAHCLIGIGVSSANRLKALGTERISEIIRHLLAKYPDGQVVLIGGPEDKEQASAIAAAFPSDRMFDTCGSLSLAELPSLVQRLTVYLGVDSGITYMADALGVPLVSVAGPCNMKETRPLGEHVVILQRSQLPCVPCAHIFRAPYSCHVGTRACIESMTAQEIAEAVISLIPSPLGAT